MFDTKHEKRNKSASHYGKKRGQRSDILKVLRINDSSVMFRFMKRHRIPVGKNSKIISILKSVNVFMLKEKMCANFMWLRVLSIAKIELRGQKPPSREKTPLVRSG